MTRLHHEWGGIGLCPHCGATISFEGSDLLLQDDAPAVRCPNCETVQPLSAMSYGEDRANRVPPYVLQGVRLRAGRDAEDTANG